jgi:hypothetical protein
MAKRLPLYGCEVTRSIITSRCLTLEHGVPSIRRLGYSILEELGHMTVTEAFSA